MTVTDRTTPASPPLVVGEVIVRHVQRVSPSFVRLHLGGTPLADFGVDGPLLDQRFKIIFPNAAGTLVSFAGAEASWWDAWMGLPEEERGAMRTYTIRDVLDEEGETRLVVDIVVHEAGPDVGSGAVAPSGPGNDWALGASAGDRLVILAPRAGQPFGGIEFDPGTCEEVLIVGDETAVPAVHGILRDLPPTARGAAFLEVPVDADVQALQHPPGVDVRWIARNGTRRGERLQVAVLAHLGAQHLADESTDDGPDDLWETPTYSAAGEDLDGTMTVGHDLDGLYAWIAGESRVVTGLRRALVSDLGMNRRQVAFMGYWREGVSMRS